MKAFNEDLKSGNLKQIYLFFGAEAYLRRNYLKRFKQALISADDTMNYHYYEGNDTTVSNIIALAETLPFFADRRVIIWENSGLFKTADEKMAAYLKAVPQTTSLLFVEREIDKRNKLFKLLSAAGGAVEFPVQNEETLKRWIGGILKKENKRIADSTAAYLLGKIGTDMENIHAELEKLICFCLAREVITETDIDAVCTTQISNRIFEMVSAVAGKKQAEALGLYHDLLALKEPPLRILFLLSREFNKLLQVKELKKKGYDSKSIAPKVGLPSFVVGKYAAQAAKLRTAELRAAVAACAEADEAVKTGMLTDRLSVELLIVEYSCYSRLVEN